MISRSQRVGTAACGVGGLVALLAYFVTPLLAGWPFSGGSAAEIATYGERHQTLFFAGAWLQTTGTMLILVFFVALIVAARAAGTLAGLLAIVASAALLSLVLVESVFTVLIPLAAAAGDAQTSATAFGLVNGTFARVFPLAPASVSYLAMGMVILESGMLDRRLGYAALTLGSAFVLSGMITVVSPIGVAMASALSAIQVVWVGLPQSLLHAP